MSSILVAVVSGDATWRRALEAGLSARGLSPVPLLETHETRAPSHARPLAVLVDAIAAPYGASELAEQLEMFLGERCPALICLGDAGSGADLFAGRAGRPDDPLLLLDELEQLIPRCTGMGSGVVSRAAGDGLSSDGDGVRSAG